MTNTLFTGKLAVALVETKDNSITITHANQVADNTLEVTIRDNANNVHGLNEAISVNIDDEFVVVTIEATADLDYIGEFYNHSKPATFKRSEFAVNELADHILQVIKSYHNSTIMHSELLMRALTF